MATSPGNSRLGWPLSSLAAAVHDLGWPLGSRETQPLDSTSTSMNAAGVATLENAPVVEDTGVVSRETGPTSDDAVVVSRETSETSAEATLVPSQTHRIAIDSETSQEDQAASPGGPGLEAGARTRTGRHRAASIEPPAKTRVLVVANQKGGVGKTTTAVNMAAVLAQHGLRVLLIDLDPQGNASTALSVPHTEGTRGVYEVVVDSVPIDDVVVPCPDIPGLDVLPASIDLAGAEIELVSLVARETRLRRALTLQLDRAAAAQSRYDYVFIDCPPSLGLLTVNALAAGQELLIPIQCEYYAMEGLSQLMRTIDEIRQHVNPELTVGAIVLTMFDARTRLASQVADEVRRHFGDRVLQTVIPRSVRVSEAPSFGQTVITYDPTSPGSLSYLEAALELARQGEVKV